MELRQIDGMGFQVTAILCRQAYTLGDKRNIAIDLIVLQHMRPVIQ
jgi:hypothetical protein